MTTSVPLPITQRAIAVADEFAHQQPTAEKAAQVRLNTLAVCVMQDYLQMIGIQTDRAQSDSWNPIVRLCANVADLQVVGMGRLECRPMQAGQTCFVPPEVWHDRIGYTVIHINDSAQQAILLGFVETVAVEALPLRSLRPPEALLDHLYSLRQPQPTVNLQQWFQDVVERGWQAVDSLLTPSTMTAFRGSPEVSSQPVRRAKLVDFGTRFADRPVVLTIELKAETDRRTEILVQVHPARDQEYLPPGLHLAILDETSRIFLQAQARQTDNYVQLKFSGQSREHFSTQIILGNASAIEHFVI